MAGSLLHPDIERHLLREEGEVVLDAVHHHWAAYVRPVLEGLLGLGVLVGAAFVWMQIAWLLLLVAFWLLGRAAWGVLREARDRFVITNMRVFRIHGVLGQSLATMPLSRILDITVVKPVHGRLLGFGHFVFESAAQEQGLRDIRYVPSPDRRDLVIQRVVQQSGLRGPRP
ncbi:PH domain-containing protein [Nocardioides sp. TRM66260-LWL]|uniref:PH domain-containing protein n=1 Tax=Nocardioides sp. TRM66260-LWL TaxID=2874478 RepID=UPI001CC69789|nr:PH domain-containing protein [Nocardioides sp. TRM66260-LWL]MBZ5734226.1 PH domain-containing protein [Nocardioides sp. TRM66260-LWL]